VPVLFSLTFTTPGCDLRRSGRMLHVAGR
jgi:hypothetical protein